MLQTSVWERYDDYSSTIDISSSGFSLKVFKAGPWLEMLRDCFSEIESAKKARDEKEAEISLAQKASKIDLGDYAEKPVRNHHNETNANSEKETSSVSKFLLTVGLIILAFAFLSPD